jgi:chromosome segregation ATPase
MTHAQIQAEAKAMQHKLKEVLNKPKMVAMQIKSLDEMVGGLRVKEKRSRDVVMSNTEELDEVNQQIQDFENKLRVLRHDIKRNKAEKEGLEMQLAKSYVTMEGLVDTVRTKKANVSRNLAVITQKMTSFQMAQERGYTSQSHRLPQNQSSFAATISSSSALDHSNNSSASSSFSGPISGSQTARARPPSSQLSTNDMLIKIQQQRESAKFHASPLTARAPPNFQSSQRVAQLAVPLHRMQAHKSFKSETIGSLSKSLFEKTMLSQSKSTASASSSSSSSSSSQYH